MYTYDQIRETSKEIQQKNLHGGKKVKKPSGEQQKRISLQDGQNNRCNVTRMKTFNEYDMDHDPDLHNP